MWRAVVYVCVWIHSKSQEQYFGKWISEICWCTLFSMVSIIWFRLVRNLKMWKCTEFQWNTLLCRRGGMVRLRAIIQGVLLIIFLSLDFGDECFFVLQCINKKILKNPNKWNSWILVLLMQPEGPSDLFENDIRDNTLKRIHPFSGSSFATKILLNFLSFKHFLKHKWTSTFKKLLWYQVLQKVGNFPEKKSECSKQSYIS